MFSMGVSFLQMPARCGSAGSSVSPAPELKHTQEGQSWSRIWPGDQMTQSLRVSRKPGDPEASDLSRLWVLGTDLSPPRETCPLLDVPQVPQLHLFR